ncbi:MAG: hypothetical protein CMM57_10750 [Rhodospirillaceae bacterium]|nr:hypothetical protein [Rhodospirillaceae bacterium]
MKMDVIWAKSPKIGIGHAVAKFGDDSLLLSSKKIGRRYRLIIGTDQDKRKEEDSAAKVTDVVTSAPERDKMDYQTIATLVKKEVEHLRKELESKAVKSGQAATDLGIMLEKLKVPKSLLPPIMEKLNEEDASHNLSSKVKTLLKEMLPESRDIDLSIKTHVLCGNYGSGKTTVALKMMLKLMSLNQAVPVLVSYKQHHSASRCSIKELSKELDIPIFEIDDVATLKKVEEQLADDSVLIVDTSTGNIKDEIPKLEKELLSVNFHLVNAFDSFSAAQEHFLNEANWSSIIVTRLEMNSNHWPLIHSLVKAKIPLSLGSISPSLNSQLVSLTKEDLINQLDLPNLSEFDHCRLNVASKAA